VGTRWAVSRNFGVYKTLKKKDPNTRKWGKAFSGTLKVGQDHCTPRGEELPGERVLVPVGRTAKRKNTPGEICAFATKGK